MKFRFKEDKDTFDEIDGHISELDIENSDIYIFGGFLNNTDITNNLY